MGKKPHDKKRSLLISKEATRVAWWTSKDAPFVNAERIKLLAATKLPSSDILLHFENCVVKSAKNFLFCLICSSLSVKFGLCWSRNYRIISNKHCSHIHLHIPVNQHHHIQYFTFFYTRFEIHTIWTLVCCCFFHSFVIHLKTNIVGLYRKLLKFLKLRQQIK